MTERNDTVETTLPEDVEKYGRHYEEGDFWRKVKTMPRSAVAGVLERALLCRELLINKNTPIWVKGTLVGVLGYFVLPCDLVPDILPGVGFMDDFALLGLVLANLDNMVTPELRDRARKRLPGGMANGDRGDDGEETSERSPK